MTLGGVDLRAYVSFDVIVKTPKLSIGSYSQYQTVLHQTCKQLRDCGWSYTRIAGHLNATGYKTTRGKVFSNAHVHSLLKKKAARDYRLGKISEPYVDNFKILYT